MATLGDGTAIDYTAAISGGTGPTPQQVKGAALDALFGACSLVGATAHALPRALNPDPLPQAGRTGAARRVRR